MLTNPPTSPDLQVISQIWTHPRLPNNYSAYVPVKLDSQHTVAFINSGNTFASVISPSTMEKLGICLDHLKPVPQLSVGTAAKGMTMKVVGQAPGVHLQLIGHKARIHCSTRCAQSSFQLITKWLQHLWTRQDTVS